MAYAEGPKSLNRTKASEPASRMEPHRPAKRSRATELGTRPPLRSGISPALVFHRPPAASKLFLADRSCHNYDRPARPIISGAIFLLGQGRHAGAEEQ